MTITLSDLQTNFKSILNRDDLGTTLELFLLNASMKMLETKGIYRGEDTVASISSPAISNGATGVMTIALPSDCRMFETLEQNSPSFKSGFAVIDRKKATKLYRTRKTLTDSTVFEAVVPTNTDLRFYSGYTATNAYTAGYWQFDIFYKAWLDLLVASTDTNYLVENGHEIIMLFALALAHFKLREFDVAANYLSMGNTMANSFVMSEYGEAVAGTQIVKGDLEGVLAKIANSQITGGK